MIDRIGAIIWAAMFRVMKESGEGNGAPFMWADREDALWRGFGLIEGEALWGYGPGGAQGFFEKCGWDGVVDGFEVRKN